MKNLPDVIANEIDDVRDEQLHLENSELVHFGLGQLGLAEREVLTQSSDRRAPNEPTMLTIPKTLPAAQDVWLHENALAR